MELTHEQLAESCARNNLTAFICGQDYWATLEDTKDNDVAEEDKKAWVMSNMLQENLNYRDLAETDDEDEDSELHSERMAARDDILCKVVDKWVAGEYTGKDKPELELAQEDVDKELAASTESMMYRVGSRMTYINLDGKSVDYHRVGSDSDVLVLYKKRTVNRDAIEEIIRHLKANGEPINFEPHNMRSVYLGGVKYGHLVGNDGFIFAMGEKMYAELYGKIQSDDALKARCKN